MTKSKHFLFPHTRKRYWINRKYKDRLFRQIFNDKKDLLSLYNAVNHTAYTDPDDLTITTLEDTIILSMKNDVSFILSTVMNLYEHQSTFNPNMPLRGVFYFSRLYETYIELYELDIYGSHQIKLPLPQFVVFYNGEKEAPDRMELKLSDAFEVPDSQVAFAPALECTATMLNINAGHNTELLEACKPLRDYSIFVGKVRSYKEKGFSLEKAVDKAIDECIREDVLVNILKKHRTLAKNSILTEYDEKKRRRLDRQEGIDFGMSKGIEIGRTEGRSDGIEIGVFILNHLGNGTPEDTIVKKLVSRFRLDPVEAEEYIKRCK